MNTENNKMVDLVNESFNGKFEISNVTKNERGFVFWTEKPIDPSIFHNEIEDAYIKLVKNGYDSDFEPTEIKIDGKKVLISGGIVSFPNTVQKTLKS